MAATEERAETDLLIVGGGNMGEALVAGLLAQGRRSVVVLEPSAERRTALEAAYPGLTTSDGPVPAVAVVIAVKPPSRGGGLPVGGRKRGKTGAVDRRRDYNGFAGGVVAGGGVRSAVDA